MNRRQFITGLGAAALAQGCAPAGSGMAGDSDRPVAVIGAGLAGLAATWELKMAGVPVRLFERSSRPGGRVWTVRDEFADDTTIDLGGMGAGQSYTNWLAYCDAFGLDAAPQPSVQPRPDTLILLNGNRYRGAALRDDPSLWPIGLSENEKRVAPFGLLSTYLKPVAEEIAEVTNVLKPAYARYDNMSLMDFLREAGATDAAIALIEHTLNYNSLETVSALSALRDRVRFLDASGPTLSITGGNGRLPEAMANRLNGEISFRTELEAIDSTDDGLRLRLQGPSGQQVFDASRVILAIPFTALKKIDVNPPWMRDRQKMIDELPYTQIAKTFVQTKTRFWQKKEADFSLLYSDTPYERVFNLSNQIDDQRGLLLNWINGTGLSQFAGLTAEEHSQRVVAWMKKVWPGNDADFENAMTVNWGNTYAGGAYAHFAPGQLQRFARAIPLPVGRIHFAGEHTELVAAGLEAAVLSGKRAASEILERPV